MVIEDSFELFTCAFHIPHQSRTNSTSKNQPSIYVKGTSEQLKRIFNDLDHPAVAVKLKVARPIAYPLAWTLSVAYLIPMQS